MPKREKATRSFGYWLPSRYRHRQYTDITHTVRCEFPTPNWDQAFALTLGREPINPEPFYYAQIHETYAPGEGELPPEDHLAFGVRDLDGTCAALQDRGLELEIEPRTYYWGRSAYLRDPGGRLIELSEQVERS